LQLTREQRKAIREIEYEVSKIFRRFMQPGRGREQHDFPKAQSRRELVARALALLTPAQIQKWHALTGEEFDGLDDSTVPSMPGFGGARGGRGAAYRPPDEPRRRHDEASPRPERADSEGSRN